MSINRECIKNMISSRLCGERKRLGYTQTQWAELIGVSRSAVAMMETELALIDAARLVILADYGLDTQFVLTGERSAAVAIENINWELIDNIARQIAAWELRRGIQLDHEKRSVVLKFIYRNFYQKDQFELSQLDELLGLAA